MFKAKMISINRHIEKTERHCITGGELRNLKMTNEVQIVVTSTDKAWANKTIRNAVQAAIDSATGPVNLIQVPGSDRKGWFCTLQEFDLDDRILDVFASGSLIDSYDPYDDQLFVVPAEWLDLAEIRSNNHVIASVPVMKANEDFRESLDIATDTQTYYLCGLEIYPEIIADDEEDDEE